MTPFLEKAHDHLLTGLEAAKRRGVAGAKLSFGRHESLDCEYESGRLKTAGAHENAGFSLEVLVDGRLGTASGNRFEDLDRLLEDAIALAAVGRQAHFDAWPAPGSATAVATHSEQAAALSRDDLLAPCAEIVDALKAFDSELRVDAWTSRSESESLLVTSGGVLHSAQKTNWSLGGHAQRTQGTDILMTGHGRGWGEVNEHFSAKPIIDCVLQDLRRAERLVEPPSGLVPAFLPPESLSMFLWPLSLGINGRNVAKGDSPLAGRLGERLLAPCFTITDRPHADFAPGAASMDGDGIPTREQVLVREGVLQRFLYDLDSAGLAGAEPTGNSGCRPYHPVLRPGSRHSDQLLAGIKDGIVIRDLIGFGQSNILNGDFSANVGLGFRVQNGEVVGRIKDCMVAGNLYELLSLDDVELSSDLDYQNATPHAVLPAVAVSSRPR